MKKITFKSMNCKIFLVFWHLFEYHKWHVYSMAQLFSLFYLEMTRKNYLPGDLPRVPSESSSLWSSHFVAKYFSAEEWHNNKYSTYYQIMHQWAGNFNFLPLNENHRWDIFVKEVFLYISMNAHKGGVER